MFAYAVESQQLLKVDALKLWSSIDGYRCWESPVPLDTQTQDHHTRTIGGPIKSQVVGSNTPGMRKNHQGQPAFSQDLTRLGITKDEIEFRVVNMCHRPSITPMTANRLLTLVNVLLEGISSTRSFSGYRPFIQCLVTLDLCVKGSLSGCGKVAFLALLEVLSICPSLRFSGHCIVVRLKNFVNEGAHLWG